MVILEPPIDIKTKLWSLTPHSQIWINVDATLEVSRLRRVEASVHVEEISSTPSSAVLRSSKVSMMKIVRIQRETISVYTFEIKTNNNTTVFLWCFLYKSEWIHTNHIILKILWLESSASTLCSLLLKFFVCDPSFQEKYVFKICQLAQSSRTILPVFDLPFSLSGLERLDAAKRDWGVLPDVPRGCHFASLSFLTWFWGLAGGSPR